ncbi:MAG: calcium-binding protein [Xenococcaceae cyanobacterium MO_188.B19]|nr:calcium-binding protein [Xenococcaceae cyanobacterium MO_188.B19]
MVAQGNQTYNGDSGDNNSRLLFMPDALKGNDLLNGNDGDDTLDGLGGNDEIIGGVGDDALFGGAGRDSLFGEVGADTISGGSGSDTIEGGANNNELGEIDVISGGGGRDLIYGDNAGPILPNPSAPFLVEGNDFITAGAGHDTVFGQGGDDTIFGNGGRDLIEGGDGNDVINAGAGRDTVFGQDGDDEILGAGGRDSLVGGDGDDTITGGAGSDTLTGNAGEDVFVFTPATDLKNFNVDIITDFDVNEDKIDLTAFGGLNLNAGAVNGNIQYSRFEFGLKEGLESAFYQRGADVFIGSRPVLGGGYGSLQGTGGFGNGLNQSVIILEDVNINDLGGGNFIFPGETD